LNGEQIAGHMRKQRLEQISLLRKESARE
jgi:hypothetical protein